MPNFGILSLHLSKIYHFNNKFINILWRKSGSLKEEQKLNEVVHEFRHNFLIYSLIFKILKDLWSAHHYLSIYVACVAEFTFWIFPCVLLEQVPAKVAQDQLDGQSKNEEIWRRTQQVSVGDEIGQRRWRWIGHTLRKENSSTYITKRVLD